MAGAMGRRLVDAREDALAHHGVLGDHDAGEYFLEAG
jgi:hypothetical protein